MSQREGEMWRRKLEVGIREMTVAFGFLIGYTSESLLMQIVCATPSTFEDE